MSSTTAYRPNPFGDRIDVRAGGRTVRAALRFAAAASLGALATLAGLLVAFAFAALVGALLPASGVQPVAMAGPNDASVEIVVLESPLHTDILLPATPAVRERFAFARPTGLPVDAAGLRWLSVGWGSRGFYTSAGSYGDIRFATALRAATGDGAVMRLVGYGPLVNAAGLRRLRLSEAEFAALLDAVHASFDTEGGRPVHLEGASLQPGDAFFQARGRFDLLTPCNEWTRRMLNAAGVRTGRWTPMTWSLGRSLDRHAPERHVR